MTDRSALERDIHRRIREKLYLWAKDAHDLHCIADLHDDAIVNMTYELIFFTCMVLARFSSMPPEDFGKLCEMQLRKARKEREQEKEDEDVAER